MEGLPAFPFTSVGYRCDSCRLPTFRELGFPETGVWALTFSVETTSSPLSLVAMAYRITRSGSMTVSPFSQRIMMGRSPRAVQLSSFGWPLMAMVVLG